MRYVNWWYIVGAIATIVVSVSLGDLWDFRGLGSVGVGWGAVIGTDLREKRKARELEAELPDLTEPCPWWIDPLVTVAISAGLIGIGLAIAVIGGAIVGRDTPPFASTTTALLTVTAGFIFVALVARACRRRARSASRSPS